MPCAQLNFHHCTDCVYWHAYVPNLMRDINLAYTLLGKMAFCAQGKPQPLRACDTMHTSYSGLHDLLIKPRIIPKAYVYAQLNQLFHFVMYSICQEKSLMGEIKFHNDKRACARGRKKREWRWISWSWIVVCTKAERTEVITGSGDKAHLPKFTLWQACLFDRFMKSAGFCTEPRCIFV